MTARGLLRAACPLFREGICGGLHHQSSESLLSRVAVRTDDEPLIRCGLCASTYGQANHGIAEEGVVA